MRSVDIRRTFLDFFTERDHLLVPSASLVPDDPSLLLTTAGMVQFKPYFLGAPPPAPRLTSSQKCVRTVDIDNIGRTDRHTTCFEMLGNFSFGDYDKPEAIRLAWELLTGKLGMDPDRLWATVYLDDEEAVELWRSIGLPYERIQRLGKEENFWDTGGPGPCGRCSEIFYDRGPAYGKPGGPAVDSDRYLEVWNLVFMRHLRDADDGGPDELPIVGDLPRRCVESGMGLERAAVVLQDVANIHRIDSFAPIVDRLTTVTGRSHPTGEPVPDRSARVVVDHVRAGAFLIADGVLPGGDGRDYVLRRLLRRAVRHLRVLGVDRPALADLGSGVVESYGEAWPELVEYAALIEQAMSYEEEAFDRTLRQGSRLLESALVDSRQRSEHRLPGQTAFDLHDRYGFPLDLTVEIARESGLDVDTDRFTELMERQRQQAKTTRIDTSSGSASNRSRYDQLLAEFGPTEFVGYDNLTSDGTVLGLLSGGDRLPLARQGQQVELVLDRTACYAEAGGQIGDTGVVRTSDGARLRITDTRFGLDELRVHTVEVVKGELRVGESVEIQVDSDRRAATARSHSATHVLHALLRRTLGEHARQHGSLVAPGRLRFDFTHFSALDDGVLVDLQEDVNRYLLDDPNVRVWHASRAEATAAGATALFGEKYGDEVRVVDIGDLSRELCGGTHVGHGSQAGPLRIVGESSIGAGLRRIEALTGLDALRHIDQERRLLDEIGGLVGAGPGARLRPERLLDRLRQRLTALGEAERELAELRRRRMRTLADGLASRVRHVGSGWLVAERVPDVGAGELRQLVEAVLERCRDDQPGGVVLGAVEDGKALLVLGITRTLADRGVLPRDVLAPAGRTVGGGAGGSGRVAQAGGRTVERLDTAIDQTTRELTTSFPTT